MEPLLEVRELRTAFSTRAGDRVAVDGASFTVKKGETLGIVGESGAGKTVTALSILGLLPESARVVSGSAKLEGTELIGASDEVMVSVRGSHIGMVFQDPLSSLNPVYRVETQLREAVKLRRRTPGGSIQAEIERLLALVEMPDPASAARVYPHQLSGGMRQRVMIAMALAGRPELLIADEPTTALDVTIQAQILDLLGRLCRQEGMAMVLITHDLGVVASVADRVVVMLAGRIVEDGAAETVFANPRSAYTRELLNAVPKLVAGPEPRSGSAG